MKDRCTRMCHNGDMESLLHIDIVAVIKAVGILGVSAMVFAESGLLIGIAFPGESLLFTAGLLASQGLLNIWLLVPCVAASAILGDSAGYWFGKKVGPKLFTREESWFFKKAYVARTQLFYQKHGTKAIVLARFVPIVRTLAPILAGVGSMSYGTFVRFNIIGGLLWGAGVTLLGYTLGAIIPGIEHYLLPIILVIIGVSLLPIVYEWWHSRK